MSARQVLLVALGALAACAPQPRSVRYFEGHPDEAAKVMSACTTGAARGDECVNAQAGIAAAARDARMAILRKSF